MEEYNKWCEQPLEESKNDPNCIHPKQPGKNLINNQIKPNQIYNYFLTRIIINNIMKTIAATIQKI